MMKEVFKSACILNGNMGHVDEEKPFSRKLSYLELFLREHPDTTPLAHDMKAELALARSFSGEYDSEQLCRLYTEARKIRRLERRLKEQLYGEQWKDYRVKIEAPTPFDPHHDAAQVVLTTQRGVEYSAQFITRSYINDLFEKNKKTGECAGGTYFRMSDMIVVERITEDIVKRTIDDLIRNFELDESFSPREKT